MRQSVTRTIRSTVWHFAALATVVASTTIHAQQPASQPSPQQAPVPAAQAAPAPKPPIPNRLNTVLPSWLRVRGEFRERVEGFANSGFVEDRDDLYYLSRFRFNIAATGKYVAATVQLQDARVGKKTVGTTGAPFKAPFDLRQAFVDVGTTKSPVAARVGRQELAFGDQRLVGHVSWVNAARTFDAARITVKLPAAQVDVFGASVVRILDGEFDRSGAGNLFAGTYVTAPKIIPKASVDPYFFYRKDENQRPEIGAPGDLEQFTAGVRLVGRLPASLDYNVEMDVQRGALASDDVRAWAGHWQLRATLPGTMTPHLTGEYNFASGDADPLDGMRGRFDDLYPTPHDKYGLSNQIGWRNIHHVRAGFDLSPFKATPITVNYHNYWLAEARDGLFTALGAPLARIAAGAPNTRVGQEVDVQIARPLTPQLAFAAGYSHLFAGPFLKAATPGHSYRGPYLMLTYVFLAER